MPLYCLQKLLVDLRYTFWSCLFATIFYRGIDFLPQMIFQKLNVMLEFEVIPTKEGKYPP